MEIDSQGLDEHNAYKLLTGIIVPRPIAWVTTLSENGKVNLAPFSAFNYVCTSPPMIGVNFGLRDNMRKDTANNIRRLGSFVANIASDDMIDAIHSSSRAYPPGTSETEILGLETVPSGTIETPRLALAPAALECRLHKVINLSVRQGDEFMIAKVMRFYVRDDLLDNYRIDARRLKPVGRLSGPNYIKRGDIVTCHPEKDTLL